MILIISCKEKIMSEEATGKKKSFWKGALKTAFKAAVIGVPLFFITGALDFTLFHENEAAMALVKSISAPAQAFWDASGVSDMCLAAAEWFTKMFPVTPDAVQYGQDAVNIATNMFPK
jgi:hypothetical protein